MKPALGDGSGRPSPARPMVWLRRLVWITLLAGLLAFLVEGADNPEDPSLAPESTGAEAATAPSPVREAGEEPAPTSGITISSPPSTSITPETPSAAPREANSVPAPSPTAPAAPTTAPAVDTTAPAPTSRRPLAGFDEIVFRITGPGGVATDGVALLADDAASRRQGLMEQTDLSGYDAMIFRFPSPSDGGFYMRNTRIPLSIAFFDAGGRFISSADMEPCPDEVDDCPTYFADRPYLHAIEVAQGELPRLGIGRASVLSFP